MGNTHVVGSVQHINKPAEAVYELFTDLTRFTSKIPEDKREKVTVTPDTLLAEVQGMQVGIKVAQRIPHSLISFEQYGAVPFAFLLNFHITPTDTGCDMHLEVDAELNMMLKMMLGGKIKEFVEQFGTQVAEGLNR